MEKVDKKNLFSGLFSSFGLMLVNEILHTYKIPFDTISDLSKRVHRL